MATIDLSQYAVGGAQRPDSFPRLNPEFLSSLQAMFGAAPPDIQANLRIMSGFRSPERQAQLWQNALAKYGSEEVARKWIAPPGRSNHNHGQAVDLRYLDPAATAWAHENAAKFGLSFPLANENWHIEPISARGGRHPTAGQPQAPGTPAPAMPPAVEVAERTVAPMAADPRLTGQPAPAAAPEGGSGLGALFAHMAPAVDAMQPMADADPVEFSQSGDPMAATVAAAQNAQKAKGLAAGLAPDISALMGLGKRPRGVV